MSDGGEFIGGIAFWGLISYMLYGVYYTPNSISDWAEGIHCKITSEAIEKECEKVIENHSFYRSKIDNRDLTIIYKDCMMSSVYPPKKGLSYAKSHLYCSKQLENAFLRTCEYSFLTEQQRAIAKEGFYRILERSQAYCKWRLNNGKVQIEERE